jgi:hypothetical protein
MFERRVGAARACDVDLVNTRIHDETRVYKDSSSKLKHIQEDSSRFSDSIKVELDGFKWECTNDF